MTDAVPASLIAIAGIMGLRGTPRVPLYFYKAVADETSLVADTDALYDKYCSSSSGRGADVTYVRNSFGNHGTSFITGAPGALTWLKGRLDGKVAGCACSETNVTVSTLPPASADLFGQAAYEALAYWLQVETAQLG